MHSALGPECDFELLGVEAATVAVLPEATVESLDAGRDIRKGQLSTRMDALLGALRLEAAEERLRIRRGGAAAVTLAWLSATEHR